MLVLMYLELDLDFESLCITIRLVRPLLFLICNQENILLKPWAICDCE